MGRLIKVDFKTEQPTTKANPNTKYIIFSNRVCELIEEYIDQDSSPEHLATLLEKYAKYLRNNVV